MFLEYILGKYEDLNLNLVLEFSRIHIKCMQKLSPENY